MAFLVCIRLCLEEEIESHPTISVPSHCVLGVCYCPPLYAAAMQKLGAEISWRADQRTRAQDLSLEVVRDEGTQGKCWVCSPGLTFQLCSCWAADPFCALGLHLESGKDRRAPSWGPCRDGPG